MRQIKYLVVALALVSLLSTASLAGGWLVQSEVGAYLGPGVALAIENDHFYTRGTYSGLPLLSGGGFMPHLSLGVKRNLYENNWLCLDGKIGGYYMTFYDHINDQWGELNGFGAEGRWEATLKVTDHMGVGFWGGFTVPLVVYSAEEVVTDGIFAIPQLGMTLQYRFY